MNILDMIPGLDPEPFETMRLDAIRLSTSGRPKQQVQAREALVLIDEGQSPRRAAVPVVPLKAQRRPGSDRAAGSNGKERSSHVHS